MPEFDRLEIQHFFEVYKDLEPGKSVEGATWVGRTDAEAEIIASRKRYNETPEAVAHSGDPTVVDRSRDLDDIAPVTVAEHTAPDDRAATH